ncbi:hypothetical protein [Deinococcus frigens]|uniref:hypothetical protein n=1 Tax=Deinococcus frigens TaxID=249403 RepID=UPI000496D3C1|nr:hypothetical protein [Deinococcus frigens]
MQDTAAEYFERSIVRARDATISNFDGYFAGESGTEYARFIHGIYSQIDENPRAAVDSLLPCIVDETIGIMLQVFDEMVNAYEIKLNLGDSEISVHQVYELLEPELRPSDGWIHKYSRQRIVEMQEAPSLGLMPPEMP